MDHPLYDVFISYAHADADWARWIHQGLTNRGLRVFLDEAVLRLGDRVNLEIEKGLEHSITVLLVVSRSSQSSAWVNFETTYQWSAIFIEGRRRLIPLMIESDLAVPPRLRNFHWHALKDRTDAALNDLAEKIRDYPEFEIGPYEFKQLRDVGELAGTITECIARYAPADEAKRQVVELTIAELVGNAFRHAPPDTVALTVNVTLRFAEILVVDSGGGFDLRDTMVEIHRRLKSDPTLVGARGLLLLQHEGVELDNAPVGEGKHRVRAVVRWTQRETASRNDIAIVRHPCDDVVVFAPQGRLDHRRAVEFEARLQPYVDACADQSGALILDLADVTYISSIGLRVLMLTAKAARSRNGTIVLCSPSPIVSEIFQISAFHKVFRIYDSVEAALVGLGTAD